MPPVYGADGYRSADVQRKKRCEIAGGVTHCRNIRHRDGNNRQPNIPFIRQGLFYPASPVEIVVRCVLPFLFLLCFLWGQLWDDFGV